MTIILKKSVVQCIFAGFSPITVHVCLKKKKTPTHTGLELKSTSFKPSKYHSSAFWNQLCSAKFCQKSGYITQTIGIGDGHKFHF
jgi:hypothetical protein